MSKKVFGGPQEGSGRPKKTDDEKQTSASYGATPVCHQRIETLCTTYQKVGKTGKLRPSSKGEIICAATRLAQLHPDEFQKLLDDGC